MRTLLVLALSLGLPACATPLEEATAAFDGGQYPLAKQRLAALEPASRRWGERESATYALYRGLAYGAVGDVARARPWLARAEAARSALDADAARRLDVALVTYDVPRVTAPP